MKEWQRERSGENMKSIKKEESEGGCSIVNFKGLCFGNLRDGSRYGNLS